MPICIQQDVAYNSVRDEVVKTHREDAQSVDDDDRQLVDSAVSRVVQGCGVGDWSGARPGGSELWQSKLRDWVEHPDSTDLIAADQATLCAAQGFGDERADGKWNDEARR